MVLWVFLENLFLNIFSYLIQNTWMRVRLRRHFAFGPIIEYFVNKFIWNIFVKKEVSGVFRHEWLNDKIWNSRSGQKKKLLEFKKPMNFMEFFDFSLWGVWAKAWSINTTPPGQLFWVFSLFSPRWVSIPVCQNMLEIIILLVLKCTVQPDQISLRVVSMDRPKKGHQPLKVFDFLILTSNIWEELKVLSLKIQKSLQPPASSGHGLYRILSSHWLALFWFGLRDVKVSSNILLRSRNLKNNR
jgi:hypothetical protein